MNLILFVLFVGSIHAREAGEEDGTSDCIYVSQSLYSESDFVLFSFCNKCRRSLKVEEANQTLSQWWWSGVSGQAWCGGGRAVEMRAAWSWCGECGGE